MLSNPESAPVFCDSKQCLLQAIPVLLRTGSVLHGLAVLFPIGEEDRLPALGGLPKGNQGHRVQLILVDGHGGAGVRAAEATAAQGPAGSMETEGRKKRPCFPAWPLTGTSTLKIKLIDSSLNIIKCVC